MIQLLGSPHRRRVHAADQQARIHSYGDSFTHCDQVSDGETWQEYLAAHFREPVENFGVGGYSVYQAYRRMLKVEAEHPGEYILLNIWSDDHFRNLDAWRSIRFGCFTSCGLTLPHIRVNVEQGRCEEVENICPTPQSLYNLCDLDFLMHHFKDDPVLKVVMAGKGQSMESSEVPISFGIDLGGGPPQEQARAAHAQAALFASQYVVGKAVAYCQSHGKKLKLLLSHDRNTVKIDLNGGGRWDESFLRFLTTQGVEVLDLRDVHRREFAHSTLDADTYLDQYYHGHYAPAGNFFMAQAMRQLLVDWLHPKPAPYA